MPGFVAAAHVHLVETSPVLRAAHRRNSADSRHWHDRARRACRRGRRSSSPMNFSMLFRSGNSSGGRAIVSSAVSGSAKGFWRLGLTPAPRCRSLRSEAEGESSSIEDSSQRACHCGGDRRAAADGAGGGTHHRLRPSAAARRAIRCRRSAQHRFRRYSRSARARRISPPMSISKRSARRMAAGGATVHGPMTQRAFLLAMGLEERARDSRRRRPKRR